MRPTTLLRGATALALLTLLSGHAGAHERWVRHELLSPFDRDLFEVAGPVNLGLLALALVIVTLVSLVARRVQDPRPSSEPVTPLRDLALAILGLTYGVGCVLATAKGEYLAPDLIGDGSTLGLVVVQGAGLTGALLALGLFTRPAAWASLGLFALAVVLRPFEYFDGEPVSILAVLNYVDVVGITLFLGLCGRGACSLDRLLGRQLVSEGKGGRASAAGLLRLMLGVTLVILGLQKFLLPELPMGVVQNYGDVIFEPFHRLLGVSEELYVFGAALVEFTVGLLLLLGVFTRLLMVVLAGLFTATLFVFEGEILGHMPLFGIVLLLLAEGGGRYRLGPRRADDGDRPGGGSLGGLAGAAPLLLVLLVACGHADARPPQVDVRDGQATGQADGTLGHFSFELAFDEPELGQLFQVHTRIRDLATGELLGDASLEVDCTMPSHGHGMMTSPRTRPGTTPDEAYTSAGMKLHMLGPWQFQLDATHGDRRDFALLDYDYLPGP